MNIDALLQVLNDYNFKYYFTDKDNFLNNCKLLVSTIEELSGKIVVLNTKTLSFELVD